MDLPSRGTGSLLAAAGGESELERGGEPMPGPYVFEKSYLNLSSLSEITVAHD